MITEMIPIDTTTTGWVIDAAKPVETAVARFPGAKGERFADVVKSIAMRIGPDLANAILNIKSVRNFVAHEYKVKKWSVPANYDKWCNAVTNALSVLSNVSSLPPAYQLGPYVQEAASFRTGLCNKKCVPLEHRAVIGPATRRTDRPTHGLEGSNANSYEALKAFVESLSAARAENPDGAEAITVHDTDRAPKDNGVASTVASQPTVRTTKTPVSVSTKSIAAKAGATNTRSIGATIGLGAALGVGLAIVAAISS